MTGFVGIFDVQAGRLAVRGDGDAALVCRVSRHGRRSDGFRIRGWIRVRVRIRLVVIVVVVFFVSVVVACRETDCGQPAQSGNTTEDCPRTPAACRATIGRNDPGKAGITAQCLSGGNVIGEHMHRIALLRGFRDVGVKRAVFVLPDQQVLAAVRVETIVIVDNQARRFDAFAFKGDVEIVTDALGHDVFRAVLCAQIRELVINVVNGANVYRAAIPCIDTDLIDNICTIAAALNPGKRQSDLFSHIYL